ncbi:hypothetical protein PFISCL1PPCAC_6711, partial [Pristionchus fissidentatus]
KYVQYRIRFRLIHEILGNTITRSCSKCSPKATEDDYEQFVTAVKCKNWELLEMRSTLAKWWEGFDRREGCGMCGCSPFLSRPSFIVHLAENHHLELMKSKGMCKKTVMFFTYELRRLAFI